MIQRIGLLLIVLLSVAACNRDNIEVQRNGDGTATITVTVSESEMSTLIQNALNQMETPLLRNPSVDLQPGQIVISGDFVRPETGDTVSGSISVAVSVVNEQLSVQVSDVTVSGFEVSDERFAEFNEQLASALSGRARRDNPRATLESVTITNSDFSIAITVTRQE